MSLIAYFRKNDSDCNLEQSFDVHSDLGETIRKYCYHDSCDEYEGDEGELFLDKDDFQIMLDENDFDDFDMTYINQIKNYFEEDNELCEIWFECF